MCIRDSYKTVIESTATSGAELWKLVKEIGHVLDQWKRISGNNVSFRRARNADIREEIDNRSKTLEMVRTCSNNTWYLNGYQRIEDQNAAGKHR